jgi:hypothetical protein
MDAENCKQGISALDSYVRTFNKQRDTFTNVPLHNWASNGADGFRCYGQGYHASAALPDNAKKKRTVGNWRVL